MLSKRTLINYDINLSYLLTRLYLEGKILSFGSNEKFIYVNSSETRINHRGV